MQEFDSRAVRLAIVAVTVEYRLRYWRRLVIQSLEVVVQVVWCLGQRRTTCAAICDGNVVAVEVFVLDAFRISSDVMIVYGFKRGARGTPVGSLLYQTPSDGIDE